MGNCEPDSGYYKLPFKNGWPTWQLGRGNGDDPVAAHGSYQYFAYDFVAAEHTDIHAARRGVVAALEESETLNASEYPPNYTRIGNYLWIRHEDNTFAVYFHLVQNGALVDHGDFVQRGDHIAEVGNTSQSGGPHNHFEVGTNLIFGKTPGGPGPDTPQVTTMPSSFEAYTGTGSVPEDYRLCYIPRVGDHFWSTQ